jgi:hypothetical protein
MRPMLSTRAGTPMTRPFTVAVVRAAAGISSQPLSGSATNAVRFWVFPLRPSSVAQLPNA